MPQQGSGGRKGEVVLPVGGPLYVHPAVDQAAVFQAARTQRRAQHAPPKTASPVAGGQPPAIPHLAGSPQQPGLTMAQHAEQERSALAQPAHVDKGGFVEPAFELGPNQIPAGPANLGILPTDELAPQAKGDPAFVDGAGSMFASNQPGLALKYGVVRHGRFVPPQLLASQAPRQQLRPETIQDLKELQTLQERQTQAVVPPTEESSEMGRAAGKVGRALSDEDKKEINETLQGLDEFDFDRWRQSMQRDVLNNEQQKKLIEGRLKPMDVGDLITQGFLVQRIDVIPNKFWFEFKTMDAETDLAIKRLIMEDSRSVEVSDRYYLDKFGLMSVAACLYRVNDRLFGDIVDASGNFDDGKFRDKFNRVVKLPMPMLSCLGANAFWFDQRVRKLFVAEAVGNG